MDKINRFTMTLFSSSKKTFGMVVILLIAVAVPITLGLIKQNQDNRQEAAAGDPSVNSITFSPSSAVSTSQGSMDIAIGARNAKKVKVYLYKKKNNDDVPNAETEVLHNYNASSTVVNSKFYFLGETSVTSKYANLAGLNYKVPKTTGDYYIVVNSESDSVGCSWDGRRYLRQSDSSVVFDGACENVGPTQFNVSASSTFTCIVEAGVLNNKDIWGRVPKPSGDAMGYDRIKWVLENTSTGAKTEAHTVGDINNPSEYGNFRDMNPGTYNLSAFFYSLNNTRPSISCGGKTVVVSEATPIAYPAVGQFQPVVSGSNITFTIPSHPSGTTSNYWVYIMRSNTGGPNVATAGSQQPIQTYNAALPNLDTFYLATTKLKSSGTSGTVISFPKPTVAGTFYVVVNAHSMAQTGLPWHSGDYVCGWDKKVYKWGTNAAVPVGQDTCENVGAKSFVIASTGGGDTGVIKKQIGESCQQDSECSNNLCGPNGKCVECKTDGQCVIDRGANYHCTYYNEEPHFSCKEDPQTPTKTPTNTPSPTRTPTATRTPTNTPTPTIGVVDNPPGTGQQGQMNLAMSVTLPGIGSGTGNNNTPRRTTRNAQVQIFNTNNEQVKSAAATFTYQSGVYSGTVNVSGVSAGTYYLKVGMDNTLFTQIPGVVNLTNGNNTIPAIALVPGDLNQDNNLNMADHSIFVGCYGEKECSAAEKSKSDFNDDGVVDGKDYNILIRSFAIRQGD